MPKPSQKSHRPGERSVTSKCVSCNFITEGDERTSTTKMRLHVKIQHGVDKPHMIEAISTDYYGSGIDTKRRAQQSNLSEVEHLLRSKNY
jgi:hypothetical protein